MVYLPEAAWCSEKSYMWWNINMSQFLQVMRVMVTIVIALLSLRNHAFWRDVYINQPPACLLCFHMERIMTNCASHLDGTNSICRPYFCLNCFIKLISIFLMT